MKKKSNKTLAIHKRPYMSVAEAAQSLGWDNEDVWHALETGAMALAEIEHADGREFDYVAIPPEAIRRIRAGAKDWIEWQRHPSMLGKVHIKPDAKQIKLFREVIAERAQKTSSSVTRAVSQREETAYLNTIGALLELLTRSAAGRKPPFPSQAKIIEVILTEHPKNYGLSKQALEDKFARAKQSLKSIPSGRDQVNPIYTKEFLDQFSIKLDHLRGQMRLLQVISAETYAAVIERLDTLDDQITLQCFRHSSSRESKRSGADQNQRQGLFLDAQNDCISELKKLHSTLCVGKLTGH